MNAVQCRIARPTNRLKEVVQFYQDALGFRLLGEFENHEGYDGVMLGAPGQSYHLEFTQHKNKLVLPKPAKKHLLVFYFDNFEKYSQANARLRSYGVISVEPENPYWKNQSETYEDPDGWRIVLFNGVYKTEEKRNNSSI